MCGRRKSSPNEVKHIFLSQEITAQVPSPQCGREASLVE